MSLLILTTGQWIALALSLLATAQIIWVLFRAHTIRLLEREKAVQSAYDRILFENPRENQDRKDGFIFGSVWRLSDVLNIGSTLGFTLTIEDCVNIVAIVKHNFDPEHGINNLIIEHTIYNYMTKQNISRKEYSLGEWQ